MSEQINASNLRIVIVDDSDFARTSIKKMLIDAGYEVAGEAPSAEAALAVIKEKKPHILITDIVMPKISGIELADKISKDHEDVYIIVISSLTQEHIILEAIGAGASDFIAKPIQPQQLIDSIDKALIQINSK
ncbi:MAG: response regulator [Bacteriovoracaceae bacterium]